MSNPGPSAGRYLSAERAEASSAPTLPFSWVAGASLTPVALSPRRERGNEKEGRRAHHRRGLDAQHAGAEADRPEAERGSLLALGRREAPLGPDEERHVLADPAGSAPIGASGSSTARAGEVAASCPTSSHP